MCFTACLIGSRNCLSHEVLYYILPDRRHVIMKFCSRKLECILQRTYNEQKSCLSCSRVSWLSNQQEKNTWQLLKYNLESKLTLDFTVILLLEQCNTLLLSLHLEGGDGFFCPWSVFHMFSSINSYLTIFKCWLF